MATRHLALVAGITRHSDLGPAVAASLHRRGAHPEAWRMNGTLQTWRPIGKTGLTPENSEDEDEEDGLMIVAAAAPRE